MSQVALRKCAIATSLRRLYGNESLQGIENATDDGVQYLVYPIWSFGGTPVHDIAPWVGLTRRSWLGALIVAPIASSLVAAPAIARSQASGAERVLSFAQPRTGEALKVVYRANGEYVPENLSQINHVMRDWRTDRIKQIDPRLLDLLWDLQRKLDCSSTIEILSGYRTPETNAMLRRTREGVAKNSYHMKGQAIDLNIGGRSIRQIRRAALAMHRGGVGYYPVSKFVHLDTGAPRTWSLS